MELELERWLRAEEAAWASRDIERILSCYAHDCLYEDLAAGKHSRGHAQIRAFLEEAFLGVPDFRVELVSFFGCDERICAEGVMHGMHTGSIVGMPPPSGKAFSLRYAHVCELRGGKAVRVTDYYDMVSLLRQLELMPR